MRKTPTTGAFAACLLLAFSAARSAQAAELSGRVRLSDSGRGSADARFAVVYFTPDGAFEPPDPGSETYEVVTVRKEFQPRVLAVPVGATVDFPNADAILHNVFSVSPGSRFDLGLLGRNKTGSHTFERPGAVRVFCNVHHAMVAYVLVMATPYYTAPDPRGGFRLEGLPAGPGTLTVWHERTEPRSERLTLPTGRVLEIEIEVTKPRVPEHRNKHGKRYKRRRRGAY